MSLLCVKAAWAQAVQVADSLVRTKEGRLQAAHNLISFGIDCLAVCGGDGSLTGADKLRGEWPELVEELHKNGALPCQFRNELRHA